MWVAEYRESCALRPTQLWTVLADVARWPEVDHNIERLEIDAPPGPGVAFRLKPRGGPVLRFTIGQFEAPSRYSDVCRLPLAVMETIHELIPAGAEGSHTEIRVRIEVRGVLAPLWGRLVGRQHAAGLPAQTERLIARARAHVLAAA